MAQDRLSEKTLAVEAGLGVPAYRAVADPAGLADAVAAIGLPAVLKTRRLGYDGKGQAVLRQAGDVAGAWERVGGRPSLLEAFVPFAGEVSVIGARGADGATALWDVVENRHVDGILATSRAPADLPAGVADQARDLAVRLLERLDYVGVLAVELFRLRDETLLFNEMAPRVHNSGHWTIEGAVTSQFEQHIRCLCGLPLGDTAALGVAEMQNLIGSDAERWPALLAEPGAHLHLYGKAESRPGRKMGHVTRVRSFRG